VSGTNREAVIRIDNVRKDYSDFKVLEGITLDIEDGDFVVFMGPTGCGRTVLLRIIALSSHRAGLCITRESPFRDLIPSAA
jgi:ABC-type sugar transport system ATPase subunit